MTHRVFQGDCVAFLSGNLAIPVRGEFDLVFADPPFNIGYEYDAYEDRKSLSDYMDWTKTWMSLCRDALNPNGTMWVAIGHEYVHRFRVLLEDEIGLRFQHHVVWHYTFGVNRKKMLTRSHTHLLHYTVNSNEFAWNIDDIRVPSWRLLNGDKRANPNGRLPDDVWAYKRICGTHKDRVRWHPCHMPEAILARIIRASSSPGDSVLDPFAGSGTTGVVAKKLGRSFVGVELSPVYAEKAGERIAGVNEGDMIPRDFPSVSMMDGVAL